MIYTVPPLTKVGKMAVFPKSAANVEIIAKLYGSSREVKSFQNGVGVVKQLPMFQALTPFGVPVDPEVNSIMAFSGDTSTVGLLVASVGYRDRMLDNPTVDVSPENAIYVLFTSGSTGTPKGVTLEHRQLFNYTNAILERFDLPREDPYSFAMISTFAADLGNTAIFPTLVSGGTVYIIWKDGHPVPMP